MSLGVGIEQNLAPAAHLPQEMSGSLPVVNPMLTQTVFNPNVKDSRWLTLEVCREFTRNKCTRTDTECKFAHPPPHVEVQNGRVTCCFDSIKGKCQRKDPPCKYLHPPQHLREQLLQNGRNNLILKQFQAQALTSHLMMPGVYPNMMVEPGAAGMGVSDKQVAAAYNAALSSSSPGGMQLPQSQNNSAYTNLMAPHNILPYGYHAPSPLFSPMPGMMAQLDANGGMPQVSAAMSVQGSNSVGGALQSQKLQRNDRLEAVNGGNVVSDSSYSNVASSIDALANNSPYPLAYSLQPGATRLVEVYHSGTAAGAAAAAAAAAGLPKKRSRDASEDLLLGMNPAMPGILPVMKHRAGVDKSGMPVYQPAGAASYPPLMQFSQQQFVPVTQTLQYYRGDQTSPYSPVAGTIPRY